MKLIEFLQARIAEDEAIAHASIKPEPETRTYYGGHSETLVDRGEWSSHERDSYNEARIDGTFMTIYDEGGHSHDQARHIARHDPARVLAECEAKRQLVEQCRPSYVILYRESERLLALALSQDQVKTVASSGPHWPHEGAEPVLRSLAAVYADHPDYREEWRP